MKLQVPREDSFNSEENGPNSPVGSNNYNRRMRVGRPWMMFFNRIKAKLDGLAGIGATTSPAATDLPTALTLVNELKTKWDAQNAALNNDQ